MPWLTIRLSAPSATRERDDLIGSPLGDAARDADGVPDQAEVADAAGGGEHAVDDRIAANDLEHRIGALVEAFDGGAETALAGRAARPVTRAASSA